MKKLFKLIVFISFSLNITIFFLIYLMLRSDVNKAEVRKAQEESLKNDLNCSPILCRDKPCKCDNPPIPKKGERSIKLNGEWYFAPNEYSMGFTNFTFFWPSKTPALGGANGEYFPEKGLPYNDHAVEIFLFTKNYKNEKLDMYINLLEEEKSGKLIKKIKMRPELEAWDVFARDGGGEKWFIARNMNGADGYPPTVVCDFMGKRSCIGGWLWTEEVAVLIRFNGIHGPDWPEIYQEIEKLLKKITKHENIHPSSEK